MTTQGWAKGDFPILCNDCLGENPYIRMSNLGFDKECKVCSRPFVVFRWSPGPNIRYRKTIVCQTCSKIRSCCQACALDLHYSIPVAIRDEVLGGDSVIPTTDGNRQHYIDRVSSQIESSSFDDSQLEKTEGTVKQFLKKMSTKSYHPYEKEDLPNICQDFLSGKCERGVDCPYRHESSSTVHINSQDDASSSQSAKKIDNLILTNVPVDVTDEDIVKVFSQYGEIKSISLIAKSKIALVFFNSHLSAEVAMTSLQPYKFKTLLNGTACNVGWGKVQASKAGKKCPPPPPKRHQK